MKRLFTFLFVIIDTRQSWYSVYMKFQVYIKRDAFVYGTGFVYWLSMR